MRTNKNGVNKDQKDKVKKDGYNMYLHCMFTGSTFFELLNCLF